MENKMSMQGHNVLFFNTLAFTVCFGAWMTNGVLVTFLVENRIFNWSPVEIGWLLGIPVLTGALFRLPAGILTDKFGGKWVFGLLLMLCAIPMYLLSFVDSYIGFALCSFGFGLTGISFAIGIAFTSVWYPKNKQGLALGIFGAGNAGAALTTLFAPTMLQSFTADGNLDGWRHLPEVYALILFAMGVIFVLFVKNKKPEVKTKTLLSTLKPLSNIRVWRFGLYYFLVFGMFVSFSQWLVPYFVNVYYLPLVTAGFLASAFSFPSGVIRAAGGWLSDKFGARSVMFWVFGTSIVICILLSFPKMEILTPGKGVMASRSGTVTEVSGNMVKVDDLTYNLKSSDHKINITSNKVIVFPKKEIWQSPMVKVGQKVKKKELLAKGITKIYFQANVWIFATLAVIIGSIWGIGKAGVYKFIPEYFPNQVGVVGGMVGVLGGLGGFFGPVIFGYLLESTGIWTTCWMFMCLISIICIVWLNRVVTKMMKKQAPELYKSIEEKE